MPTLTLRPPPESPFSRPLRIRYRGPTAEQRRRGDRSTDQKAIEEVHRKGAYRSVTRNFDVRAGEVWLDVGAHIGAFAFYAVLRGAAKVVCVEAEAANYALLCRNVRDNGLEGVVVPIHAAVVPPRMARRRAIDLHLPPDRRNTYRASVMDRPQARRMGRVARVAPVTLARLSRDYPGIDAMKVDIEGAEVPLLLESAIPRGIDKIVFEYTMRSRRLLDIERRLRAQGLEFVGLPPHLRKLVPGHIDEIVFAARRAKAVRR